MVKKINNNLPKNKDEIINKTSEVIAKILINKLNSKEIDGLAEFFQKDKIHF